MGSNVSMIDESTNEIIYEMPWFQRFFLSHEAVRTSREAVRREKPLVSLDLRVTFMQTPEVFLFLLLPDLSSPLRSCLAAQEKPLGPGYI